LHVILGWRPVLLLPFTFALFTPLSVPAFAWWAAALNSLPMLAAIPAVCGDGLTGVLRRLAVLRKGGRHSVRGVRHSGAVRPCHIVGLGGDRVAAGVAVVGVGAGGDRGMDRGLSGCGRPEAVEPRRGNDVGPVEPLGDSRHRAGSGWRTVGLAALGASVTVGDAAGFGDGAGLGGARGRGGDLVHPQAAGRPAVAG